jgi:hypothetical protein
MDHHKIQNLSQYLDATFDFLKTPGSVKLGLQNTAFELQNGVRYTVGIGNIPTRVSVYAYLRISTFRLSFHFIKMEVQKRCILI